MYLPSGGGGGGGRGGVFYKTEGWMVIGDSLTQFSEFLKFYWGEGILQSKETDSEVLLETGVVFYEATLRDHQVLFGEFCRTTPW